MPVYFLGEDLVVGFFIAFFLQILDPPPTHKGSAVFLNIGLTHTC